MKQCSSCSERKPLGDFYCYNDQRKNRYYAQCKLCHGKRTNAWHKRNPHSRAEWNWRVKYGIRDMTEQKFQQMLSDQASVCAICEKACASGKRLSVDHDHATGEVRGLLCLSCNQAVGKIENGTLPFTRLAAYLQT